MTPKFFHESTSKKGTDYEFDFKDFYKNFIPKDSWNGQSLDIENLLVSYKRWYIH